MACDMLIAGDDARFGQPEINLGVIPGAGGTQRLTRAIGPARAMELILTGRTMDADEAFGAGLVTKVVPAGSTVDAALELAGRIADDAAARGPGGQARGPRRGRTAVDPWSCGRTSGILRVVRYGRPGRRDERVHRETSGGLDRQLTG